MIALNICQHLKCVSSPCPLFNGGKDSYRSCLIKGLDTYCDVGKLGFDWINLLERNYLADRSEDECKNSENLHDFTTWDGDYHKFSSSSSGAPLRDCGFIVDHNGVVTDKVNQVLDDNHDNQVKDAYAYDFRFNKTKRCLLKILINGQFLWN